MRMTRPNLTAVHRLTQAGIGHSGACPQRSPRTRVLVRSAGTMAARSTPRSFALSMPEDTVIATPLRTRVRDAVGRAWAAAIASGELPAIGSEPRSAGTPEVQIERPADPDHGDFATNLAMKLARPYRRSPLDIAGILATAIGAEIADPATDSPIASVWVAAPGFLNLVLSDEALEATVAAVVASPTAWGRIPAVRP